MTKAMARDEDFASHFIPVSPSKALPRFGFEDASGRNMDLTEFRGRFVLLNLWATWCGPCVREMGSLDNLSQKMNIVIVPIIEDHDGLGAAQAFYKRHNLEHLVVYVDSSGAIPSILNLNGLPTSFLIDPKGLVIGRVEGEAHWDNGDTMRFLQTQIENHSPPPPQPQARNESPVIE